MAVAWNHHDEVNGSFGKEILPSSHNMASHNVVSSNMTSEDNERAYVEYGEQLRNAVASSLKPWLADQVQVRFGIDPAHVDAEIDEVAVSVHARLSELVHADVDTPLSGPLERIRSGVELLGPRLQELGATPPVRDPFDVRVRPDDLYALGPIAFADLGEEVHMAGISWGAAKAYLHQARRK